MDNYTNIRYVKIDKSGVFHITDRANPKKQTLCFMEFKSKRFQHRFNFYDVLPPRVRLCYNCRRRLSSGRLFLSEEQQLIGYRYRSIENERFQEFC